MNYELNHRSSFSRALLPLLVCAVAAVAAVAACGRGGQQAGEVAVADTTGAEPVEEATAVGPVELSEVPEGGYVVTRDGIAGVVEIGQSVELLPAKAKGLYDKRETTLERDETEGDTVAFTSVVFKLRGRVVMEARSWEGRVVDLIHVVGDTVHLEAGGKTFGVGSNFAELEKHPNFRRLREYRNVGCLNGIFLYEEEGEVSDIWVGGLPI